VINETIVRLEPAEIHHRPKTGFVKIIEEFRGTTLRS
jgi:hypothetical protein